MSPLVSIFHREVSASLRLPDEKSGQVNYEARVHFIFFKKGDS